jgi:DNA replication protein DnaC
MSDIPEMFKDAVLDGKTEATRILKAFLSAPRTDVFRSLHGKTGTGKTHACWAFQKKTDALYYTANELYRGLLGDVKWRFEHNARKAQILILDELGREPATQSEWFEGFIDELVDLRWQSFRKTIIATNLNIEKFTERYGERVASRIAGNGEAYELSPVDLRRDQGR